MNSISIFPKRHLLIFLTCLIFQLNLHAQDRIGDIEVKISVGDMTTFTTDAYIVPHFGTCASFGGVGGAVARSGGGPGLKEFDEYITRHGKQEFGFVHLADSGGGNSRYVLNVVSVGSGAEQEFEVVTKSILHALKTAGAKNLKAVAMPALGTGIIGDLTSDQSAKAMMAGVQQFVNAGGKLDKIDIVIFGDKSARATFQEVLRDKKYLASVPEVGMREFDMTRWVAGMQADAYENERAGIDASEQPTQEAAPSISPKSASAEDVVKSNFILEILLGDITKEKVDAYIVPHFNSAISYYRGVGGLLAIRGGYPGLKAYKKFVNGRTLDFGTAHVTKSGGGNAQYLINVVSLGSGADSEYRVVSETMYNALEEAEARGIKSVAAPAMGTEIIGHLSPEQSAMAMIAGIKKYAAKGGTIQDIKIVISGDQNAHSKFVSVRNNLFSGSGKVGNSCLLDFTGLFRKK